MLRKISRFAVNALAVAAAVFAATTLLAVTLFMAFWTWVLMYQSMADVWVNGL